MIMIIEGIELCNKPEDVTEDQMVSWLHHYEIGDDHIIVKAILLALGHGRNDDKIYDDNDTKIEDSYQRENAWYQNKRKD